MPITAKPFSWGEMLRKVIFAPRPAYFNAVDLNKEFDILHNFMEKLSQTTGVTRTMAISLSGFTTTDTPPNRLNEFNYNVPVGTVFYKGVRFTTPAFSGTHSHTFAIPTGSPLPVPVAYYLCVTADLSTVDFATSPALAGIQSTEYPFLVPSCEVEQYDNVALQISTDPSSLGNLVCILATYRPYLDGNGDLAYYVYENSIQESATVPFVGSSGFNSGNLQANGSLLEEINQVNFEIFLQEYLYAKIYSTNNFQATNNPYHRPFTDGVASYDSVTQVVTLSGEGNSYQLDITTNGTIDDIVPDGSLNDYTEINIWLSSSNFTSITLNPLFVTPNGKFVYGSANPLTVPSGTWVKLMKIEIIPTVFVWVITGGTLTTFQIYANQNQISDNANDIATNTAEIASIEGAWTDHSLAFGDLSISGGTASGGTVEIRYKKIGKTVHMVGGVAPTFDGGAPTNIQIPLPTGFVIGANLPQVRVPVWSYDTVGTNYEYGSLVCHHGNSFITITRLVPSTSWAVNAWIFQFEITFEID